MEPEELDAPEVLEIPEEVLTEAEDEHGETIESLTEKNKHLFARAKKAEGFELVDGKWVKPDAAPATQPKEAPGAPLSASDTIALLNAKVHEDDIERVERFAKSEGVSIKDALKNSELKAILSVRSEERDSAAAANTGPVRRGPTAMTADVLLDKASKGDLPDSDDAIERLIKAKAGQK